MVQSCYTWVVARVLNPAYCFSEDSIPRKECSLEDNALAAAAHFGLNPLFRKLVDKGVKGADTYFGRPLECAARRGDYDMTYILLEKGFKLYSIGFSNCRALERASRNGHYAVVCLLLEPKYNLDYLPRDIENAIREAAAGGHQSIINFLKPHTRRLFEPSVVEDRILMAAALHDKEDVARVALDNGADPNAPNYPLMKWSSVLEGAARKGYEGIVKLLLERGATLRPRRKANPLIQAIRGGWPRIVQMLIDYGAEVNPSAVVNDPNPSNTLVTAVERGDVEMVKLLLVNGAEARLAPKCVLEKHLTGDSDNSTMIKWVLAEHQAAIYFDQSVD
jgi:ankyrin repeat protein